MEIRKCAHCNGDAYLVEDPPGWWSVECSDCAARTALSNEETAVRLWNRREGMTAYLKELFHEMSGEACTCTDFTFDGMHYHGDMLGGWEGIKMFLDIVERREAR